MTKHEPFSYEPQPTYRGWSSTGHYLTLRDGTRLAVEVVLPRNVPAGTRLPALLSQTRYWRTTALRCGTGRPSVVCSGESWIS